MTTATPLPNASSLSFSRVNPLSARAVALFPDYEPQDTSGPSDLSSLLSAARSHPAVFLDCFCRIYNPNTKQEFPFHLWEWQWQYLALLLIHKRVVTLKARQLGVSWLVAGYALWMAIFHKNTSVLLVSMTEGVAAQLLAKCTFIFNRLPDELKPPANRRHDKSNATELAWYDINSKINAVASTPNSGRSESSSLVIADEWSSHPFSSEMFSSFSFTAGREGQIIGVSTAQGRNNFFHSMYIGAKRKDNDFTPIFLSAKLHPDYTDEFLERERKAHEARGELWRYYRELPTNDMEAFGGSTETFFPANILERLYAAVLPAEVTHSESPWDSHLFVWSTPKYGMRYTIGADVADVGPDSSVAMVLESVSGRHVATLRSPNYAPYEFASLLNQLGRMYAADPSIEQSYPVVAVERNNHGIAVIEALDKVWRYPNLYRTPMGGRVKHSVLGWLTSSASRPVLLNDLKAAIVDGGWNSEDEVVVDELASFEDDRKYNGHDDHVFAGAIAWQARKSYPTVRGSRKTQRLSV